MTVPVTRYFHGGIPGLEVGDRILPPSVTGTPTTADYAAAPICRRDRVYASTELRIARVYAALAPLGGHGDVYQVALQDPNERDGAEVAPAATRSARRARPSSASSSVMLISKSHGERLRPSFSATGRNRRGFGGCRALSGLPSRSQASLTFMPAGRLSGADRAGLQR
jgi:hypothetical protein